MNEEIVLTLVTGGFSLIGGYLVYRYQTQGNKQTQQNTFIDNLIERVEGLETRVDTLGNQALTNLQVFEDERRKFQDERNKLTSENEERFDKFRKETRRLLEDKEIETSVWRNQYRTLEKEHIALQQLYAKSLIELAQLNADFQKLQEVYETRIPLDKNSKA